jgi:uncharacterized membrane protein
MNLSLGMRPPAELLRKNVTVAVVGLAVLAYASLFSYFSLTRFWNFQTYAWDLGLNNQAFYTTVKYRELFYSTPELPFTKFAKPSGTLFAEHFTPIYFVIAPVYAAFPFPQTLLILKSLVLSFGAYAVFLLARWRLGNLGGAAFALAYLLHPGLHGVNLYDFQPHSFMLTFLLFTLYFYERGMRLQCLASFVLALASLEVAPLVGILIGVSGLLRIAGPHGDRRGPTGPRTLWQSLPIQIIVISAAYLALFYVLAVRFGWPGAYHPSNTRRLPLFEDSGAFRLVAFDWRLKLLYVVTMFAPMGFLSLLDPVRLLPGAVWFVVSLLSTYPPYYQIQWQYPAFALPFIVYSAIFGAGRLAHLLRRWPSTFKFLPLLPFLAALAFDVGWMVRGWDIVDYPSLRQPLAPHSVELWNLLGLIPHNKSVLTQNNVFPEVSSRMDAYVVPFSATFRAPGEFESTLKNYLQRSDFVVLDPATEQASTVLLLGMLKQLKEFGLLAEIDGSMVFKRGHRGGVHVFLPLARVYNYAHLVVQSGEVAMDPSLPRVGAKVLRHRFSDPAGDFWYGPGIFLARGTYIVRFNLKLGVERTGRIMAVAVVSWPTKLDISLAGSPRQNFMPVVKVGSSIQRIVAVREVRRQDLQLGTYVPVSLTFSVEEPGGYEFVGLSVAPAVDIFLRDIELTQMAP